MIHWPTFIASSLRLVDLLDSTHEPGKVPVFNREERKGRDDALWIELGIFLLEYLREESDKNSHDFVSILSFIEIAKNRFPALQEDDVLYVCSVLATPCLVHLPDFMPNGETKLTPTKDTNLIEQLSHGKRLYRLTPAGRIALSLASGVTDLLYVEEDASKVFKALQYGDYLKVVDLCSEIRSRLVESCHDIHRALSRPGYDEIREHFIAHRDNYLEVVKNVQETIRNARAFLNSPDTEESVESWATRNPQHDLTIEALRQSVTGLNETLEILARTFAGFVRVVAEQRVSSIGLVDFSKLSHEMLAAPPSTRDIVEIWRLLGPCSTTFAYAAPDDFRGCLRDRLQEKSESRQRFGSDDSGTDVSLPSVLERLLEKYGKQIAEELKAGPLPLSRALANGWYLHDSDEAAPFAADLVGIYVAPDMLELGGGFLGVGVSKDNQLDFERPGGRVVGDDLVLVYLPSKGE